MRLVKPITSILALILLFLCNTAMAKDRTPEPKGIETNGFVLHPGATLGIGFDTYNNRQFFSSDGMVDIGLHFKTRLENEELYSWNNSISFDWNQYWGLSYYQNANGGPDAHVSTHADLFKKSIVRLTPSASYKYNSEAEDSNLNTIPVNHSIVAGTYMTVQPGSGAIFSERVGYHFNGTIFQHAASVSWFEHRIDSLTRWNFLPQTHMALAVDFRYIHYMRDTRKTNDIEAAGNRRDNPTGMPVRIKYSLGGLLTQRLSYDLGAGYAFIYYDPGTKVHSWLLNALLRYDIRSNIGMQIEYKKDFETSTFADYYNFHRVVASFDAIWFDKLQTEISAGYGYYDYQTDFTLNPDIPERKDHLISLDAGVHYQFLDGLRLGLTYRLRVDNNNLEEDYGYARGDFSKNRIMLKLNYEY